MFDLEPLFSRIIIEKKTVPEKVGIIYIPEASKEMEPTEGTVIAVGPDVVEVKVGDVVFFGRYSGFTFTRNNVAYVCCNVEDLIATIKPNIKNEF